MEIKVGDKVVFKKWEELDEEARAVNDEEFYERFSGKTCTVCNVIERPRLAVEVEEDDDIVKPEKPSISDLFLEDICGIKFTKQCSFSEKFIKKIIPQTKTNEAHDFGYALKQLKAGKKMRRRGWNGKGIFIELQRPDKYSKMTHPYIFIDTTGLKSDNPDAPRDRVPWLASQTDMLAEDWEAFND